MLTVPYRTNILLLPPYPSKTRPVKFQSKNRREKAVRTTNNLLHSGLVSAHPHKIHSKIALQSRKITGRGEYLGRANAPAEAPGPGRSEEYTILCENYMHIKRSKMYRIILKHKIAKKLENNAETWYNFGTNKPVLVRQRYAVVL